MCIAKLCNMLLFVFVLVFVVWAVFGCFFCLCLICGWCGCICLLCVAVVIEFGRPGGMVVWLFCFWSMKIDLYPSGVLFHSCDVFVWMCWAYNLYVWFDSGRWKSIWFCVLVMSWLVVCCVEIDFFGVVLSPVFLLLIKLIWFI